MANTTSFAALQQVVPTTQARLGEVAINLMMVFIKRMMAESIVEVGASSSGGATLPIVALNVPTGRSR